MIKRYEVKLIGWGILSVDTGPKKSFHTKKGAIRYTKRLEKYPSSTGGLRWVVVDRLGGWLVYDSILDKWKKAVLGGN